MRNFAKTLKVCALSLALLLMLFTFCACFEETIPQADTTAPETEEIIVNSNNISISGKVLESDDNMDNDDNVILAGVTCQLLRGETVVKECLSDENGAFSFRGISAGTYTVVFSIDGYITGSKEITVKATRTLTAILDKDSVSNTLKGSIMIADADTNLTNNAPLGNAPVRVERISSLNEWIKETVTDSDGSYTLEELTAGVYKLTISIPGYIDIEQIIQVKADEQIVQTETIEAIEEVEGAATGSASGTVINSRTGSPVEGITVYLRKGINTFDGTIIKKLTTDANGSYNTGDLEPGNYTAQFVDERENLEDETERFGSLNKSIKVLSNEHISNQSASITNTEGLSVDTLRIVLTWGATPSDLDSHFYAVSPDGDYHIYHANREPADGAMLDVDDTSSYGPETTTVTLTNGVYNFGVYNYSDKSDNSDTNLARSGACVKVYIGISTEPEYTFYVPTDGVGPYWDIFSYNTETEQFTIHNTVLGNFDPYHDVPPTH